LSGRQLLQTERPVNLIKASDEWRLFLNVKVSLDDAMEIYADAKQVLLDF